MSPSVAVFPLWIKVHFYIKNYRRALKYLNLPGFFFFHLLPFIYEDDSTDPIISMTHMLLVDYFSNSDAHCEYRVPRFPI